MRWLVATAALLLVAWPLLGDPTLALADPLSELPVRLFVYERVPWLGGVVDSIGFPRSGPLNDPDPLGSAVTSLLRPALGRVGAYDAWVLLNLAATLLATLALGRVVIDDDRSNAPMFGAVAFALTPLALVYGVAGAVVDLLALWPWALCARSCVLAWRHTRRGDPAIAGLWAAVGFVASPYHLVVFTALGLPALIGSAWASRRSGSGGEPGPSGAARLSALIVGGLVFLAVAGPYAWHLRAVMDDPTSQMSTAAVAASRHTWPFPLLHPDHTHRYTAFLGDYLAVGKGALIERVAASRFYRAFSPGILLFGAAGAGWMLSRAARPWLAFAAFAALASTGPYAPVIDGVSLPWPINPAWWILRVLPGGGLLLEPFRYALPAALALAMAGTLGVHALARRYGAWVPLVATAGWLLELVLLSPVPFPLPTSPAEIQPIYAQLGALPKGAVLELPYFDRGTDRFDRSHFLHQLVHGRPIPDEVLGFVPEWLAENQFTAALLHAEKPSGALGVPVDTTRIDADRARFAEAGFALVVLTEARARHPERLRALLAPFGEPVIDADGRAVWVVTP